MNPLEILQRLLFERQQGQGPAQQQLAQQGSVMARPQLPQWRQNLPQTLGPTAGTAAQAGLNLVDMLTKFISPLDAMAPGGESALAHVPGTYRAIGLERSGASGTLNPAQYLAKLQTQPNYERFKQLVQMITRQNLGESFPVARGASQIDPLVQAINAGSRMPVTAVTHDVTQGTAPTAERFAQTMAETQRKPTFVTQGMATPQDVAAFVPRRGQYSGEAELILNPTAQFQPQLTGKYIPPSSGFPFVERKALPPVDDVVSQIKAALEAAAQPLK